MPSLSAEPSIYPVVVAMAVWMSVSKSGSGCSIVGAYFTKADDICVPSSSAHQHLSLITHASLSPNNSPFGVLGIRQPAQARDAGEEAVLTSYRGHEPGYAMHASAYRSARDGERAAAVVRPGDRVVLVVEAHEVAVVLPLRLDELELAGNGRTHEDEHPSPFHTIVFHRPLGQHGAVGEAAPHDAVDIHVRNFVFEGVPRVDAADVGAGRALEALRVLVVVAEVVVAL